jgi:uncharacterized protein (DUF433 family)
MKSWGMSPDEIVDAIPTITLADVHAALAYSWDNREDLDGATLLVSVHLWQ